MKSNAKLKHIQQIIFSCENVIHLRACFRFTEFFRGEKEEKYYKQKIHQFIAIQAYHLYGERFSNLISLLDMKTHDVLLEK